MRDLVPTEVEALHAAERIQSERYIGSEFVRDARVLARFIIERAWATASEERHERAGEER